MSVMGWPGKRKVLATAWAGSLLLACGQAAEEPAATGGAWSRAVEAVPTSDVAQLEIVEIRFEPEEPVAGGRLRAHVEFSGADNGVSLSYTWRVDDQRMPVEGPALRLPRGLPRGTSVVLEVKAETASGDTISESASVSLGNRAPRVLELGIRVIEGEEDLGEWVADPIAEDPDDDDVDFRYEWRLNGERVVSESERLTRTGWTRGDEIRLTVWPSDGDAEGPPFEGAPFSIGNSPPEIVSRPPGLDSSGRFIYQVEAEDPDGDRGLRYALVQGPDRMDLDPFAGKVTWQATMDDAGEHVVEIEVDDRNGGTSRQTFFVAVQVERSIPPAAASPR